jgi:hypothetical protein
MFVTDLQTGQKQCLSQKGGDTATPVAHLQLLNAKTTAGTALAPKK